MKRLIDIGFIGLGNMGRPMAARLAEAGFNLTVFDVNSRVMKSFSRKFHAKPAADAGEAGRNNSTENKFKQFILSRKFDSGFSLDLMLKDLSTAVQMARETHTPALFSSLCRELWAAARSSLPEGADHTAVVCWQEEIAKEKLTG